MVIRESAAREITRLLDDLRGAEALREAAVARLGIIGTRAVARLLDVAAVDPSIEARTAALRALEIIGDRRAVPLAERLLGDGSEAVAVAAANVLHGQLRSAQAVTAARALDLLTATCLDRTRLLAVRLVALDGLRGVKPPGLDEVLARVKSDPDDSLGRHLARPLDTPAGDAPPSGLTGFAASGVLPARPGTLRTALAESWTGTPLSLLHRLVDLTTTREANEPDVRRQAEWRAARGDVHLALARRGSRVALYDLRDTVAGAEGPLPDAYASALAAIGDVQSLDAIAAAYDWSAPAGDRRWVRQLAEAFGQIVERERLTGRHAAIRRLRARWPRAADALFGRARPAARQ